MTPNLTTLAAATLPFAYDAIFNTNHCISALTSLIPHCYTAAIGSGIAGLGLGLGLMAKRYIKIPNAISSRAKSAKRVITGFPQSFMENLKTQKWYSTKEFIKGAFLPERKLLNQTWQNKSYLYKIPLAILSVPWKGIKLLA